MFSPQVDGPSIPHSRSRSEASLFCTNPLMTSQQQEGNLCASVYNFCTIAYPHLALGFFYITFCVIITINMTNFVYVVVGHLRSLT